MGNLIQSLIPRDDLPPGISGALGCCTAHGMQYSIGVVHQLGCSPSFGTNGMASRVLGIGLDLDQLIVFNRVDRAATRSAQCAIPFFYYWHMHPPLNDHPRS